MAVYYLFLERLFSIFANSAYKFKKRHIQMSRVGFALYLIAMYILFLVLGDADFNHITNSCIAAWPFWLNILVTAWDLICCISISILFARRLLSIKINTVNHASVDSLESNQNVQNNICDAMQDDVTRKILKRSTLLTSIALFTTTLSLLFSAVLGLTAMWIALDMMVNSWCIILMFKPYHGIYIICCGKMENCVGIKCLRYYSCNCCCSISDENHEENKRGLELEIQMETPSSPNVGVGTPTSSTVI